MPGMFGQNTKNARKFCEIPKMPGCFRKYQKCPGRSDKAWSWHMPARFIKITSRKETYRRRSPPKGTRGRQSIECCFGWCFKQTRQDLFKTAQDDKMKPKDGERPERYISMAWRWRDCEWYEALTIPCLSERVIETALWFHLERSDVSNDHPLCWPNQCPYIHEMGDVQPDCFAKGFVKPPFLNKIVERLPKRKDDIGTDEMSVVHFPFSKHVSYRSIDQGVLNYLSFSKKHDDQWS